MSNLNLVKFEKKTEPSHDQQEVIRLLEEALHFAKSSNYTSLAIVMIREGGDVLDCWHNGGRPYVMLGAFEAMKADFLAANIEAR